MKLAGAHNDLGYGDVLILRPETFRDVFTDKRIELVDQLLEEDVESIRELAQKVDREPSAVHRDLAQLFEVDVVGFKTHGNRKQPYLKHDCVTVYPFDMAEDMDNLTEDLLEGDHQ